MKILFVWPNQGSFGVKPIGISLLTSVLERDGHEVGLFDTSFMDLGGKDYNDDLTEHGYFKPVEWPVDVGKKKLILDDELEKKIQQFKPNMVAISALNDEIALGISACVYCEISNIPVLWGNKAASSEIIKKEFSYIEGESVGIILHAVEGIEKFNVKFGQYGVEYKLKYFKKLDSLPYLDWTNFDDRHFLKAYDGKVYRGGDHMIGWGCTNSCSYCINEYWRELHGGMKGCIRRYSVGRIVDELQALTEMYQLEFWKFHDEDFLLKPVDYLEDLSRAYSLRVGLPFTCMLNAKNVTSRKVQLLKAMGCVSVSMGIETGDPVMRSMLNRRETPEDIISASEILQNSGIRVSAFNMIGLPFESERTIKKTIDLNKAAKIKHPNISLFMPLEGTRLYDISVKYKFYEPNSELSTNKPSLKLPDITEKKLMWYYNNFHNLVTGG